MILFITRTAICDSSFAFRCCCCVLIIWRAVSFNKVANCETTWLENAEGKCITVKMCAAHTAKVSAVPRRGRQRGSDGGSDRELELESVSANWLKSLREFAENSCTQVLRLRLWSGLGMATRSGDSWKVAALTPSWGESVSQSQSRFMRNFITRAQWEIGICWVSLSLSLELPRFAADQWSWSADKGDNAPT